MRLMRKRKGGISDSFIRCKFTRVHKVTLFEDETSTVEVIYHLMRRLLIAITFPVAIALKST